MNAFARLSLTGLCAPLVAALLSTACGRQPPFDELSWDAGDETEPGTDKDTELPDHLKAILEIGAEPVSPNPSLEARILLNYLYSIFGKQMLSGQKESTWLPQGTEYEMDYLLATTGRLPAIRGLDFIDDFEGTADRAIAWGERGGIPTISWHIGAPTKGDGYEASLETVDLGRVLTIGTPEYASLMASFEKAAVELKRIQEAGVPILWRPFHELDGGWFWWSKGTPEQLIVLFTFMFDYFTHMQGINNLIWVAGFTAEADPSWYPGDDYVDIVGADAYTTGDAHDPQLDMYSRVASIVGVSKPICYHECGAIPDPTRAFAQDATWLYFMTWHTEWLTDYNDAAFLNEVYNHDLVITLDELPDLWP